MGIDNLLDPKPEPTRIGEVFAVKASDLVLDALINEDESLPNKITDYPVEDGASMADAIIPQANHLSIEGRISNSPLYDWDDLANALAVESNNTGSNQLVGRKINRAELAWKQLSKWRNEAKLLHVISPRGTWTNYAIEDLSRTKNKMTGETLAFSLKLKQVRKVTLRFVQSFKSTRTGQTQPAAEKGSQVAAEESSKAKVKASILKKLSDGIGITKSGSGL